jgi:hypothetical protein
MFVFTKQLTLSQLVPASSFYPGRGDTGNMLPASTLFFTENNETNITGNDSDVESVADWLDDLDDPTPRQASKFSDAVAIEVCFQCLIKASDSKLLCRDHCGVFQPLLLVLHQRSHVVAARLKLVMLTRHKWAAGALAAP